MKALRASLFTVPLVSGCGGGSGSSRTPPPNNPPTTGANQQSYVNFMKTAFSDWAGENYSIATSTTNRTFGAELANVSSPESNNDAGGTSSTNVQVTGVDEADLFKFSAGHLLSLENSTSGGARVRVLSKAVLDGLEAESYEHLPVRPTATTELYSGEC